MNKKSKKRFSNFECSTETNEHMNAPIGLDSPLLYLSSVFNKYMILPPGSRIQSQADHTRGGLSFDTNLQSICVCGVVETNSKVGHGINWMKQFSRDIQIFSSL